MEVLSQADVTGPAAVVMAPAELHWKWLPRQTSPRSSSVYGPLGQ